LYWKLDVIFTWVDKIRVGICDFYDDVSGASIKMKVLCSFGTLEMYGIKDDVTLFYLQFLCSKYLSQKLALIVNSILRFLKKKLFLCDIKIKIVLNVLNCL
jgi:hypothetical protein